ncbi:MAG: hypothetical protein JXA17_04030 [Dehalococcoidales bacterium]|nr:hypothetical protein [Dehalococcoidales bacterium]
MKLLKTAIKKQNWDLAAHVIVLATVRVLNKGVKPDARKTKEKKGRPKG